MTLPVVFTANGAQGYNLTKSLRFRSSASAYLNRTPASAGTGTGKTWTWSGWVKRGTIGSSDLISLMYGATSSVSSDRGGFGFYTYSGGGTGSDNLTLYYNANFANNLTTTQVFRDPSAWYHIIYAVDTTQATASNRVKLYVNGVQVTAFSASNYPTQNYQFAIGNNVAQWISSEAGTQRYFDGYLAEVNFIDGQALTPSSFGETDAATGVWKPKKFSGTYGTNGFYLKFTDNSSLSALGTDSSGNGNTWTVNNFSVTSTSSAYDSMNDVPTLTSATTANYCTLNPVNVSGGGSTITNGNLNTTAGDSGTYGKVLGTFGMITGKWYWEVTSVAVGTFSLIGIGDGTPATASYALGGYAGEIAYVNTGNKYTNNSNTAYGSSYTTNDVIGVAYDADAGSITFYKNGTSQGAVTGFSGTKYPAVGGYSPTNPQYALNFGQRPFAYTPPTGFVALNTFNLPTPTIGATASSQANKYFDATLFTGTGANATITNSGSMQPDFVWGKSRSNAFNHILMDSVRGTGVTLFSNSTSADYAVTDAVTSFNSNGFSYGVDPTCNTNGSTNVFWQWRASNTTAVTNTAGSITSTVSANTTAGFSIVTFTMPSSGVSTIGHGLGVAPSMVILKSRANASGWVVYHSSTGAGGYTLLNTTAAYGADSNAFNNTAPTSSVFTVGTSFNGLSGTYLAYCFAEVAGYSKFGSYIGNGSSDGPFVFTGFRPRYVLVKRSDSTANWTIRDTARNPYNSANLGLFPNLSAAEDSTSGRDIDILSNGFKIRGTDSDLNTNGGTYIYACFAENPFKYSLAR